MCNCGVGVGCSGVGAVAVCVVSERADTVLIYGAEFVSVSICSSCGESEGALALWLSAYTHIQALKPYCDDKASNYV